MHFMDTKIAYKSIIFAQEQVLAEIRLAIQNGDRQRAVSLAAQRYELLKQLAEAKTNRSFYATSTSPNLRSAQRPTQKA
jgi:chorismate mutase